MTGWSGRLSRVRRSARASVDEFGLIGGSLALFERQVGKAVLREDDRRDRLLGLDTATAVPLAGLHVSSPHHAAGFAYVASPARLVRAAIASINVRPAEFAFVDLGSGKGRVLMVAAEQPFAEVIGVEFALELHDIAVRNVERYGLAFPTHTPITLHHGDAAVFDMPMRPCVVYLNNPFSGVVLGRVLARMERSLAAVPRPLYLIYQEARHEPASDRTENLDLLAEASWLRKRPNGMRLVDRAALITYRVQTFEAIDRAWVAETQEGGPT